MDFEPYNPLSERNLGASVAEALLERSATKITELPAFNGAGIYAIYYIGDFPAYEGIASRNREGKFEWPIYVGKAIPSGARKGGRATGEVGSDLLKRLKEHRSSLNAAINLNVEDFYCRMLVVTDIWIPLGESLLIAKFSPLWNSLIDGFGNHTPGKGRLAGMIPRWDVVHPGRSWAPKCAPRSETAEQILGEVAAYIRSTSIPSKPKIMSVQQPDIS